MWLFLRNKPALGSKHDVSHEPIADAVVSITVFTSFGVVFFVAGVGVFWRVRLRLGLGCSFGSVFLLGCSERRSVGRRCVDIVLLEVMGGFLFGFSQPYSVRSLFWSLR